MLEQKEKKAQQNRKKKEAKRKKKLTDRQVQGLLEEVSARKV